MNMISFAVTPEDAILLTMAADGATLRLALPEQDEKKKEVVIDGFKKMVPTREQMAKIFADNWDDEKKPKSEENQPKLELVKVKVPAETIEAGTEITEEVLAKKFKEVEFPKDFLPAGAATEDKDLAEKFASHDLAAGLLASKAYLSKTKPVKPNEVVTKDSFAASKVEVSESDVAFPKGETDSLPVPVKKDYTYVRVVTAQGTVVHKYEVTPKGNVYVGVVTPGLND